MTSMTPAEVDAYQARLRELLDERRDWHPRDNRGRLMLLLTEGRPRRTAGLS